MSYWMMLRRKRLIASSGLNIAKLAITYSAEDGMTDEIVTMADGKYRLLTLTKSGTLNIPEEAIADVWLCGGGAHGVNKTSYGGLGGGGGFVASAYGISVSEAVAIVGAASGETSFMDVSAKGATNQNGGSGGGGNYWSNTGAGTGAGVSTYPFEDTTYFSGKPHCAGGGGGGTYVNARYANGGNGGSNGSEGSPGTKTSYDYYGGSGGLYGGGHGCSASSAHASRNATFYGGGGGGRGAYDEEEYTARGTGYQGVIYVRIPLKQPA